jgi:hypothetical protein
MRGPHPSSSKYDYDNKDDTQWHMVTAWIPVQIGSDWFWLCDVMRRRVYTINTTWTSRWEYRLPTLRDQQKYMDEHR